MSEQNPDYRFSDKVIRRRLVARIGEYSILNFGNPSSQLMIPAHILTRAGIISGPEGDEFDLDLAVKTVREHAFDPALN